MSRRAKLSIILLAIALLCSTSAANASKSNEGFAAYNVAITLPGGQGHSVVINETVRGTDKVGLSDLILQFTGGEQNLTYSKLVNSSQDYFPYLSNAVSQSFEFSNGSMFSIHANFSAAGTTTTAFQGSKYSLSVFDIAVDGKSSNRTVSANGTIEVFPSSLIYSMRIGNTTSSLDAVLLATDLTLAQPSAGIATATAAYVGAGVGVGGVAAGAALMVRRREQRAKTPEQEEKKPIHWVD